MCGRASEGSVSSWAPLQLVGGEGCRSGSTPCPGPSKLLEGLHLSVSLEKALPQKRSLQQRDCVPIKNLGVESPVLSYLLTGRLYPETSISCLPHPHRQRLVTAVLFLVSGSSDCVGCTASEVIQSLSFSDWLMKW